MSTQSKTDTENLTPRDDAAAMRPFYAGIVIMWLNSVFAWGIILCDTIHHGLLPEVTSLSMALILISRKNKVDKANGIAKLVVELMVWMAVGITLLR